VSDDTPTKSPVWLQRWPWVVFLLVVALAYFGSYYRHGINFQDEGGMLTHQTQRLLTGELPLREVFLGYNVGWFYPLVALFKVTGVDFVALRVFFMVLSTLAAVLGFLTVEKAARYAGLNRAAIGLGAAVGLLLIATPGMMFKNYNPLATVANAWCLLGFVLAQSSVRKSWKWTLGGGFILGATWLVRIDLGTLFTLLWGGVLVARTFEGTERLRTFAVSSTLLFGTVVVLHVPVFADAYRRGFGPDLTDSYIARWRDAAQRVGIKLPAQMPSKSIGMVLAEAPVKINTDFGGKSRISWAEVQSASEKKKAEKLGLFLLTYAPLVSLIPLALLAAGRWFRAVVERRDPRFALAAITLVGAALAMFPQYFFWRPDAPHLSEFGPGYWVAIAGAFALLGMNGNRWQMPSRILAAYLVLHCAVWCWRILPDRWCGTIAARENRKTLFEGENGARVYEQKKTVEWMKEAHWVIRANSTDTDYLVAWPYHPSFNVLSNRRSYEWRMYMDETLVKDDWNKRAIVRMELRKPRIVVISNWDVNGTDASRFKNWGASIYAHIQANYELLGTYDEKEQFEVWKRK
jgi:hypothetical protein